ncbi:hypothetical protein JR316_0010643 [Psilocybe cubensis]|uniref:Fungal-type protein kinase domain-containing protein n=2 Tax=Psilocybe cubensis TaxID=181762 RepID=A0A8H7XX18_PSICU|nr:hypothetical protein JR316_0010643 [Psilocybe cubensis]KAH9476728.1 hypothetical protein JR316_0010643 [Psilocybe cubensis]
MTNENKTKFPDTPRSQKSFGQDIGIVQLRNQIAREMDGEFITCPVESFMETYLPFVPTEKETQYFVKKLLEDIPTGRGAGPYALRSDTDPISSVLTGDETNFAFRAYPPKKKMAVLTDNEIAVFKGWEKIAETIGNIDYPGQRNRNKFSYVNVPYKPIDSPNRGSNNKIDAAFVAAFEKNKPLLTTDIAVVMEHKLSESQKRQNALQAVSANVQIMNDDVRRMFTFGITGEQRNVTLWYHGRSHSAASHTFDFTENPKLFIQVFIAFSFATEEELGYDPTVTLEADGNYMFKLPESPGSKKFRLFRTLEPLSLYRSNNITGRMARVYKVVEINESGEEFGDPLVLKDVWLDSTAETERKIQDTIFGDIEQFWNSTDEPTELKEIKKAHQQIVLDGSYKKYFLEIVLDHSGQLTKLRAKDGTQTTDLLAEPDPASHVPRTGTKTQKSQLQNVQASVNTHPIASRTPKRPVVLREYSPKRQYRVLFKELCETVGRLETLGEVVNVLYQTLTPLQLLFCAGWVHRDISSGNILAFKKNLESKGEWFAKLSDLEYAKKFPLPNASAHAANPKTGTPYFMPLEVMLSTYLFSSDHDDTIRAKEHLPPSPGLEGNTLEIDELQIVAQGIAKFQRKAFETATAEPPAGVAHNFQHDLESLWWILLWNVCCRLDPEQSTPSLQNFGKAIFINEIRPTDARIHCITKATFGESMTVSAPKSIYSFVASLFFLRQNLYSEYVDRGREGAYNDVGSYAKIHNTFFYVFKLLNIQATEALDSGAGDGRDLHWSELRLLVKNHSNTAAEGSIVGEPERKRPRSNEDHVDARAVESEGRPNPKQPRKK